MPRVLTPSDKTSYQQGASASLKLNDSSEKRGTMRRGKVYVGARAAPAPPHIPLPTPRGYFFSVLRNEIDSDTLSLYSRVGVKGCAINAWQRTAGSRGPSTCNVHRP
jgi:hypothetical protein